MVSGPATIVGNTLTLNGAGTVVVRASQAGNTNFSAAAPIDQSFTVRKIDQSITFRPLVDRDISDPPFTLSAVASSGLDTVFSMVSGPATIVGNTLTLNGAGTVVVRASQAGNTRFSAAAPVDQSFTVRKLDQSISFAPLPDKYLGDPPFTISAKASSGLPTSLSVVSGPGTITGTTLTLTGHGIVVVRATQAGNDNYAAAPSTDQSFAVKSSQSINFPVLADKVFGDAPFTLAATASLPPSFSIVSGPATIEGATITLTGAGIVVVRASQAGNEIFAAAASVDETREKGVGAGQVIGQRGL
jgi:ribosomal protein S11